MFLSFKQLMLALFLHMVSIRRYYLDFYYSE